MTPKVAAFRTKASTSPPAAISSPPIAGPITKARLSSVDQALLAGPSCSSSATREGRYAPIAGPKNVEKHVATTARITIRRDRRARCDERRHEEHEQPACDVRDQEDQAAVVAVGDQTRRNGQDDVWEDPRRAHDPQDQWVVRNVVDQDQDGDEVEPVADRRDELPDQEAGQRPVVQQETVGAQNRGHRWRVRPGRANRTRDRRPNTPRRLIGRGRRHPRRRAASASAPGAPRGCRTSYHRSRRASRRRR